MAEPRWTSDNPEFIEFGWVEGYHLTEQWLECGWAELGWIEGDDHCPYIPDAPPPKVTVYGGGGTGFERGSKSRISLAEKYTKPYLEKPRDRRKKRLKKQENSVIEFIVRFTTEYL